MYIASSYDAIFVYNNIFQGVKDTHESFKRKYMKVKVVLLFISLCFLSLLSKGQTILNPGDLVILGIDANLSTNPDEISFACFQDITTGTEIQITDQGYERCNAGLWGSGEGGAKLTRVGGTIPAGTVITFRTQQPTSPHIHFTCPDTLWSVANLGTGASANSFNMNSGGDQVYFAQNGTWASGATCSNNYPGSGGRMLFAFSTSGGWVGFTNSTQASALYPGMDCFSMAPTTASDFFKYTGPMTAAYQKDWINRINSTASWTHYASSAAYLAASPNLCTTVITIIPGTDADWTPPVPDTICQSASPINLNSLISGIGQTGGTWSGTGVTGNTFNPAGLNGTYNITYTNDCPCCISQTHTITVNSVIVSAGNNTPICSGTTLDLTSLPGGATSYSWSGPNSFTSTLENPIITNVTAADSGTYTVTVTANGCISSKSTSVHIKQSPIITSGPFSIPNGTSTTLNTTVSGGSGSYTYNWAPSTYISGSTTIQNPVTTNLSVTTVYTVTVTDATTGCTGTEQVIVNVTGSPLDINTVTATPSSICYGDSTLIQATATGGSGSYTYLWSPATGLSNSTISNPIASPTITTSYTVTANDGSNTASSQVNITVYPLPTASASHSGPVCTNNTLSLTSGGGTTYSWSGPNSFSSLSQNPSITGLTPLATGTYIVTVTDSNGCSATAQTIVNVNVSPTANATNNTPCEGQPLNLSSGGGVNYSWSGPNGFISNAEYPIIINADTVSTIGTYSVTVTDGNGCTATAQTVVVVNSNPVAMASSSTPCEGQTLNLNCSGNPANNYIWSGPGSFSDPNQNPIILNADTSSTQGIYTVTVTDGNGCTATAQTTVTINSNPLATASSNKPCEGHTLNLLSSGGSTYNWAGPNSFSNSSQNPTIPNADTSSTQGIYTVTVTDINGCSATAQTTVIVNKNPIVTASSNTPCVGQALNLNSGGGSFYSWTGPNGFSSSNQSPSINGVTMSTAGIYTVTAIDAQGCSATISISVIINALPTVSINIPKTSYCISASPATLTGTPAGGNFSGAGVAGNTFNPSLAGIGGPYELIYSYTDADSCSNSDTVFVSVTALPTVALQNENDPTLQIYTGEVVTIAAIPANYQNYDFYIGGNLVQSGSSNIYQSTNLMNGDVLVVNASEGGCAASDSITLDIKPIPNAFIPDGSDGENKIFLKGLNLQIFNRWNQQLYSGTDGWDGKYKGKLVSPGTYYYIVTLTNLDKTTKTIKGSVIIISPHH